VLVDFAPDRTVVLFTIALCVATVVLFGLAPALQASRPALLSALKDGGGGTIGRRTRLRTTLVGAQVALCTVLIAVASLLVHSLANARDMDPGFDARGLIDVAIDLRPRQLDDAGNDAFYQRLVEQARALPGVRSVSVAQLVPLAGSNMQTGAWVAGAPAGDRRDGSRALYFNVVGAGYFETLGLPVVRGRGFGADDRSGAPETVVVNETLARRMWPKGEAVGQHISTEGPNGPWKTVVGVARDAKYNSLGEEPPPFMYLPQGQTHPAELVLHVRATPSTVPGVQRALRSLVARLDPLLPPPAVTTAIDDMRLSMLPAQLGAAMTTAFGALALLLAAVGIYGVVAYAVARRTREIGVRAALGAGRVDLVRLLMMEAGRAVFVGLAIGLGLALGMGRVLSSVLYDVGVIDPISFIATPLVLATAAGLAAYIPARRATRVSPVVALRSE
jgi:predicted permease